MTRFELEDCSSPSRCNLLFVLFPTFLLMITHPHPDQLGFVETLHLRIGCSSSPSILLSPTRWNRSFDHPYSDVSLNPPAAYATFWFLVQTFFSSLY